MTSKMTTEERARILNALIAQYERFAFTNCYVFGFIYEGYVYAINTEGLASGMSISRESSKNGGGFAIRWNPTAAMKKAFVESGARKIATAEWFENEYQTTKHNRGEIFERLITEEAGQTWAKDSVPFDKGADLTTAAGAWSIKFQAATIASETYLKKLG